MRKTMSRGAARSMPLPRLGLGAALAVALACASCTSQTVNPGSDQPTAAPAATGAPSASHNPRVRIETSMGNMTVELFPDKAPKTVDNFLKLVRQGFYDGILFHRVERDFVIQGGDPNTKAGDPSTWGNGGPGYTFEDEPVQGEYVKGTLCMANAGPNTNGSQFFICTADVTGRLPKNYNLFGLVVDGMSTVDSINNVAVETLPGGMHRPMTPVKILRMTDVTG